MMLHKPIHPGRIIYEILIVGTGLKVTEAAKRLDINRRTLSRLLNRRAGISPDMALRLSKLLPNTDITLWMNVQRDYDIWQAKQHSTGMHIRPLKAAHKTHEKTLDKAM